MAQVNITQHAEITLGTGQVIRLGSKLTPSSVTLSGNGRLFAQSWIATSTATQVLDSATDLSDALFIAVRCSVDAVVSWAGTQAAELSDSDTSSIKIEGGVWQFFSSGSTTEHNGDSAESRSTNAAQTITQMWVKPSASGNIDIFAAK